MRTGRTVLAISFLCISIASAPLRSQTIGQKPSFEVAIVKPVDGDRRGPINITPGGRFIAAGQTLEGLIAFAYRVRNFQIIDGPGWIRKDLWEIQAKAPEGSVAPPAKFSLTEPEPPEVMTKPEALDGMIQALLEDRFVLRFHRTKMDQPVYEVLVAKGGPKIKLADDQNPNTDRRQAPTPPVGPDGLRSVEPGGYRIGGGPNGKQFEAKGLPLWVFANSLTNMMGIKVIDRTA